LKGCSNALWLHTKLNLFIFRLCFSFWRLCQDWRNYTLVLRQLTNAGQKGNGQKGNCQYAKEPRVAAGPTYLSNRPGFPPQPVAINLKDRHKSDAFSTLIKDAYCPHYIFRFSAFLGLCSSSFSQFGSEIKNINKYLRRRSH